MPSESGCPQTAVLEELAQGRLPAQEAARVAAHAANCPRCSETLAAFRSEATGQPAPGSQASRSPAGPVGVTTSRTAAASSVNGGRVFAAALLLLIVALAGGILFFRGDGEPPDGKASL